MTKLFEEVVVDVSGQALDDVKKRQCALKKQG